MFGRTTVSFFSNFYNYLSVFLLHATCLLNYQDLKHWRAQGIVVFNYINDGLDVCPTQEQAFIISTQVRKDIQQAGFLINEKSRWEPSTRIKWIGFIVDSLTMKFYIMEEK